MKRALRWLSLIALGLAIVYIVSRVLGLFASPGWPADAVVVPRDVPTLAEALERAMPGSTIVLRRQDEPYRGPIRLDVADVRLIAAQPGTRIEGAGSDPAVLVAAEGVSVGGFEIRAESIAVRVEAGDALLDDMTIEDTPIGIQLAGVQGVELRDLSLFVDRIGIELVLSNGNRLESIDIVGAREAGVRLLQSETNVFRDFEVSDCGVGVSLDQGSSGNTWEALAVRGSASAGVDVRASNDNAFRGCTVVGGEVGLSFAMATENRIDGGAIADAGTVGVSLDQAARSRISGVVLDRCRDGVSLTESSENTISYNEVSLCTSHAIRLDASDRNLLLDNQVATEAFGIVVEASSGNRILRNDVRGAALAGIVLRQSVENLLLDNEVHEGSIGIAVAEGEGEVLHRNRLWDQQKGGIAILPGSSGGMLSENAVSRSGFGLEIAGSGNVDVSGNTFEGNEVGVFLSAPRDGILIEANTLRRNETGIEQTDLSAAVEEQVTSLELGTSLDGEDLASPRMANNVFAGNRVDVANRLDLAIHAAGNWWGDGTEGGEAAVLEGNVLVERSAWTGTVAVGTDADGVQQILGRILQQTLESAGYKVIDLVGIGDARKLADAFRAHDVDLIWWSTDGDLGASEGRVVPVPARAGWAALASPSFAEGLAAETLSAVSSHARSSGETIRFAAPQEFGKDRFALLTAAYGLDGAAAGITWARTRNEAEALAKLGAVDIALVGSLEETLTSSGFSVLEDDLGAIESSQIALVVGGETLVRDAEILDLIAALAPRLTTEALHRLNGRVQLLGEQPEDVVREFLESGG
jgi:parallel beta-helix repeat protein